MPSARELISPRPSRTSSSEITDFSTLQTYGLTRKGPCRGPFKVKTGGDLLSQGVAPQVPSALQSLTTLFGMGRGVSSALLHHRKYVETYVAAMKLKNCTMTH